jgi:hypothetical protein
MSIIDDACMRVQDLVLAVTDEVVKTAPDYVVDDAMGQMPMSNVYLKDGEVTAMDASGTKWLASLACDVFFNRTSVRQAYKQIHAFTPDFIKRLGGDPTLGGKVSNIVYPVKFSVKPATFDNDQGLYMCVSFDIPIKFILISTVTP